MADLSDITIVNRTWPLATAFNTSKVHEPGYTSHHAVMTKNLPEDDAGEYVTYRVWATSHVEDQTNQIFSIVDEEVLDDRVWVTPEERAEHPFVIKKTFMSAWKKIGPCRWQRAANEREMIGEAFITDEHENMWAEEDSDWEEEMLKRYFEEQAIEKPIAQRLPAPALATVLF